MKRTAFLLFLFCSVFAAYGQKGDLDFYLSAKGLVDIMQMDTSLRVQLRYALPCNFLGEAVYKGVTGAWLHSDAAAKLLKAQRLLKAKHPELSLFIYDAARPMSVQRAMWNLVKGTDKTKYVSNPVNGGGLHNYGMAVDLTIIAPSGKPLDMGTPFDYFGPEAHINNEDGLLKAGKISREVYNNRQLLRSIMKQAGFRTILYEWWHFNACSREEAKAHYKLIE
ncbi:D-alanyl-D-alanine dipeptidase [Bacteroidia bacterium]|nr:D-alanyl-D-alanine dipeptidase [Bacteroidia bacterium]